MSQNVIFGLICFVLFIPFARSQTCSAGFFGPSCSNVCHCKNVNVPCNKKDGNCEDAGGCNTGFKAPICNETCDAGTHGDDCKMMCNCKNKTEACDREHGQCLSGCAQFYKGKACDEKIEQTLGTMTKLLIVGGGVLGFAVLLGLCIVGYRRFKNKDLDLNDPSLLGAAGSRASIIAGSRMSLAGGGGGMAGGKRGSIMVSQHDLRRASLMMGRGAGGFGGSRMSIAPGKKQSVIGAGAQKAGVSPGQEPDQALALTDAKEIKAGGEEGGNVANADGVIATTVVTEVHEVKSILSKKKSKNRDKSEMSVSRRKSKHRERDADDMTEMTEMTEMTQVSKRSRSKHRDPDKSEASVTQKSKRRRKKSGETEGDTEGGQSEVSVTQKSKRRKKKKDGDGENGEDGGENDLTIKPSKKKSKAEKKDKDKKKKKDGADGGEKKEGDDKNDGAEDKAEYYLFL